MSANTTTLRRCAIAFGLAASLAISCMGSAAAAPAAGDQSQTAASAGVMHRLNLTIRDRRTGAPIRGVRVAGYSYNGPVRIALMGTVSDARGLAAIVGPGSHGWRLRIEAPGYETLEFSRFATDPIDNLTIGLRRR